MPWIRRYNNIERLSLEGSLHSSWHWTQWERWNLNPGGLTPQSPPQSHCLRPCWPRLMNTSLHNSVWTCYTRTHLGSLFHFARLISSSKQMTYSTLAIRKPLTSLSSSAFQKITSSNGRFTNTKCKQMVWKSGETISFSSLNRTRFSLKVGLGQVCADRTPEKATLRKILELLPQGKDRGLSYMETILPLEGPSIVGTLMAFSLFFSKFRKENIRNWWSCPNNHWENEPRSY